MRAVHFGAGNIGRGFIGEVLAANGFEITFVDVNHTIIDALNERKEYEIELADESKEKITVKNVKGINNQTNAEKVIQEIAEADLVTTAIGPNILPFIAELIAKGIQEREKEGSTTSLDIIACENMIGGSAFLEKEVYKYLPETSFTDKYIGFPNAAVDRIVPLQHHEDPLFVQVEPFKEWVIDDSQRKNMFSSIGWIESISHYLPTSYVDFQNVIIGGDIFSPLASEQVTFMNGILTLGIWSIVLLFIGMGTIYIKKSY